MEKKQYYTDASGDDWIDEFARTKSPEEFRAAMSFVIGKYLRRLGKKDSITREVEKISVYAARWLEYENNLPGKNHNNEVMRKIRNDALIEAEKQEVK